MKRLFISLLIGILIGLVSLCVTTEVMGFVYVNNDLSEYVSNELFVDGGTKVILSICAGTLVGILIYIYDCDIKEWKKMISLIIVMFAGFAYSLLLKAFGMPMEKILNSFIYYTILIGVYAVFETINKEILKKDIKKINEKLKK